ncbi:unnamed protein product, partial [Rotaria sp. Silwood1]
MDTGQRVKAGRE